MRNFAVIRAVSALALASCGDSPSAPTFGTPATMLILEAPTQIGVAGQPAPAVPAVLVLDAENKPVGGIAVTFVVGPDGGSVTVPSATTDSRGKATPGAWTLGATFGSKTLTATTAGVAPVEFSATAIAPDAGVQAFLITDAAGDTIPTSASGFMKAHDVVSVRGDFKRDSLIVTFTFTGPVGPISAGVPAALGGYLEFDTDESGVTGIVPSGNAFGGSASLGVDYQVNLFEATGSSATLHAIATGATSTVSAAFSGSTMVLRVPMRLLGNDDGRFAVVGIIGTIERPTDFFPNTGGGIARPGG